MVTVVAKWLVRIETKAEDFDRMHSACAELTRSRTDVRIRCEQPGLIELVEVSK